MTLIFQYGSNATRSRLNGPNRLRGRAEARGRAQSIDDFDIAFDVYSQTNGCAAADLVEVPGRKAWGILYEIADDFIRGRRADNLRTLAQIEGAKYQEQTIRVRDASGEELHVISFTVIADARRQGLMTSAAYVSWIVYGLRDHGVPEDYISHVIEVAASTNERSSEASAEQTRLLRSL